MKSDLRDQIQAVLDLLDEVMDSDDLSNEDFHVLNDAYHKIESVLD